MKKTPVAQVVFLLGIIVTVYAVVQLVVVYTYGEKIWPHDKNDVENISYAAIAIGLFFINKGANMKKRS